MRVPGAFADSVVDPANLTVLPESELADIALAEPLACVLHTIHLGQAALSSPYLIRYGHPRRRSNRPLTALAAHYYDCTNILMARQMTPKVLEQVTTAATYNLFQAVPDAAENCDILITAPPHPWPCAGPSGRRNRISAFRIIWTG